MSELCLCSPTPEHLKGHHGENRKEKKVALLMLKSQLNFPPGFTNTLARAMKE